MKLLEKIWVTTILILFVGGMTSMLFFEWGVFLFLSGILCMFTTVMVNILKGIWID